MSPLRSSLSPINHGGFRASRTRRKKIAQQEFNAHVAAWNSLSKQAKQGKKPPRNKVPKMKAACIRSAQHNRGNIDGGNCRECRLVYVMDPMGMFTPRTSCVTCHCACKALFPADELHIIEQAIASGILETAGTLADKQPPISTYQQQLQTATNNFNLQTTWGILFQCSAKRMTEVSPISCENWTIRLSWTSIQKQARPSAPVSLPTRNRTSPVSSSSHGPFKATTNFGWRCKRTLVLA
jgi:hypothetical protein